MNKRDRLTNLIQGNPIDRIPVALWRRFPGDDQRASDFARSVIDFQRRFDWDFINVIPASNYLIIDYGVYDEWTGNADGLRTPTKTVIHSPADWGKLRPLSPDRGELNKQLTAIRLIQEAFTGEDIPIIVTIPSPMIQAQHMIDSQLFLRHLRLESNKVSIGLTSIAENTNVFIEALSQLGIDGIHYIIEHADYDSLSATEYETYGLPLDLRILNGLPSNWWLNLVTLRGQAPMFHLAEKLQSFILNWNDHQSKVSLLDHRSVFSGMVAGGVHPEMHLRAGTPATIRDIVRNLIIQMGSRRFILTSGDPILSTTPLSNLFSVRDVVESVSI